MVQLLWKTVWQFFKKLNIELSFDWAIPLRYIPKRNKNTHPHENLYISAHSSITNKNQKWKQPKCPSTNEWINKNLIYSCSGILFGNKKEWSTDTCYNMDEPWKDVKWKNPVTKDHILYDYTYMKCPEQANP